MNREDIIRMAESAGINVDYYGDIWGSTADGLLRFAALVAAHVRETESKPGLANYRQGLIDGAAEERKACAKVADECWVFGMPSAYIAAAIRARGGE